MTEFSPLTPALSPGGRGGFFWGGRVLIPGQRLEGEHQVRPYKNPTIQRLEGGQRVCADVCAPLIPLEKWCPGRAWTETGRSPDGIGERGQRRDSSVAPLPQNDREIKWAVLTYVFPLSLRMTG